MITLDEAIARERKNVEDNKIYNFENIVQYHSQLTEWLEELKVYQQHKIICNKGYNSVYNKAIDDFVKFANTMTTVEEEDGTIRPMWLEEMAKQLKERNIK